MKNFIIEYGGFIIIVMGGFYFILGKNNKYLNLPVFIAIFFTRYMGKLVGVYMQENNAGGTTPYNPLKIPAKKITPANH